MADFSDETVIDIAVNILDGAEQDQYAFESVTVVQWLIQVVRRKDKTQLQRTYSKLSPNERAVEDVQSQEALNKALQLGSRMISLGLLRRRDGGSQFTDTRAVVECTDKLKELAQQRAGNGGGDDEKQGFSSFASFARRKWTIKTVLADENVRAVFDAYAYKSPLRNFMAFWTAVTNFKNKHATPMDDNDVSLLRYDAKGIWEQFLESKAEDRVDFSDCSVDVDVHAIRTAVRDKQTKYRDLHSAFDTALKATVEILDQKLLGEFLKSLGVGGSVGSMDSDMDLKASADSGDWRQGGAELEITEPPEQQEESPEARQRRLAAATQRRKVALEILTTEESYVDSLQKLISRFIIPLKKMAKLGQHKDPAATRTWKKKIISRQEFDIIASNVETLLPLHEGLVAALSKRLNEWGVHDPSSQCVAEEFLKFSPYFKMYPVYVNNYELAAQLLKKFATEKKYKSYLKFHDEVVKNGAMPLESYLIMPIQRIPRYVLLLTQLLKHTDANHPDYYPLQEALAVVRKTAGYINESIRAFENKVGLQEVQKEFSTKINLVQAGRYFLRRFDLFQLRKDELLQLRLWLCNDVLLLAEPVKKGKRHKLKTRIDINEHFYFVNVPDDDEKINAVQISTDTKSLTLITNTPDDKDQLVRDLVMCQNEAKSSSNGGPEAVTSVKYEEVEFQKWRAGIKCLVCSLDVPQLKVPIHCMNCGNLVHDKCSRSRLTLDVMKGPERVCDSCFPQIQNKKRYGSVDFDDIFRENSMSTSRASSASGQGSRRMTESASLRSNDGRLAAPGASGGNSPHAPPSPDRPKLDKADSAPTPVSSADRKDADASDSDAMPNLEHAKSDSTVVIPVKGSGSHKPPALTHIVISGARPDEKETPKIEFSALENASEPTSPLKPASSGLQPGAGDPGADDKEPGVPSRPVSSALVQPGLDDASTSAEQQEEEKAKVADDEKADSDRAAAVVGQQQSGGGDDRVQESTHSKDSKQDEEQGQAPHPFVNSEADDVPPTLRRAKANPRVERRITWSEAPPLVQEAPIRNDSMASSVVSDGIDADDKLWAPPPSPHAPRMCTRACSEDYSCVIM